MLAKALGVVADNTNPKESCFQVLQNLGLRNFRIGASKVFMKIEEMDVLEKEQQNLLEDVNNNQTEKGVKKRNSDISQNSFNMVIFLALEKYFSLFFNK